MYEVLDVVELNDGTVATILEKYTDTEFLFEVPDKEHFMKDGSIKDIKRKIS